MGHEKTLVAQVGERLESMAAYGQSRKGAKADGSAFAKIFSYESMKTYKAQCYRFVKWVRANRRRETGGRICRLDECKRHADAYLAAKKDEGCSAATLKTMRAALRKLYQDPKMCEGTGIEPTRRSDVTRSRNAVGMDRHYSESRNEALTRFCRATGLRRHELAALRRDNPMHQDEKGRWWLDDIKGKGGRVRSVLVLDPAAVLPRMDGTGERVFDRVHSAADIHGFRRDYARAYYESVARDPRTIDVHARYCCQGEARGRWFDRAAIGQVSLSLGHNRLNVTVSHYLI